jgi:hypothetical protein
METGKIRALRKCLLVRYRTRIGLRRSRLDPRPYTPEYEALEFYSVLVEEYEAE